MFTPQCGRETSWYQPVDDLNVFQMSGTGHDFKHGPIDGQRGSLLKEPVRPNFMDQPGFRVMALFGIVRKNPIHILNQG